MDIIIPPQYNKGISKISRQIYYNDNLEQWLNSKELFIRCQPAKDCRQPEQCKQVLDHSFPLRMVRVADLSSNLMGISFNEHQKLDEPCRLEYYNWTYDVCYKDKPQKRVSKNIFERMLAENTLKHSLEGAGSAYHASLENYSRKESSITRDQLEAARKYMNDVEHQYHTALRELKEEIDRAEAIAKNYETEELKK